MTTRALRTIDVIRATPPKLGACNHPDCRRAIEWVTTRTKDKQMPIDAPLLVLGSTQLLDGRVVVTIDSGQSHFATCPYAQQFRRARR